jgi:tubulin-specific chaperone D
MGKSNNVDPVEVATKNQDLDLINDDEQEVTEGVEEAIELLLSGLSDRDTTVRYSSAKGIGRIANRLDYELADQILGGLIDLLRHETVTENGKINVAGVKDATWHGACLALAEFTRRGLLLPERLESVLPWTVAALLFEQRRPSHSIG